MLEAARDLFEAAPKVATALEQAAINSKGGGTKKEGGGEIKEVGNEEAEVKKTVVPKALTGVSMSLIEKIRAKERDKKVDNLHHIFVTWGSLMRNCRRGRCIRTKTRKYA